MSIKNKEKQLNVDNILGIVWLGALKYKVYFCISYSYITY